MATGHSHRSTLKKDKKPFKSRHASKGQVKARNQGKVEKSRPSANSRKNKINGKLQRKNMAKQLKEKKILHAVENRKLFQSSNGLEKIVTIVSLTEDIDEADVLNRLVDVAVNEGSDEKSMLSAPSVTSIKFTKFKSNFKFILPNKNNFLSILDAARVSDFVIFALSANEEVDTSYGEQIIRAIELQGISNSVCVVPNLDTQNLKDKHQKDIIGSLSSYFRHFFPNNDKVFNLNNSSDLSKVVHHLSSVIPKGITWLSKRGYLIADDATVENNNSELVVTGTVRGSGFYVNQLVNIPNVGQFKVKFIEKLAKRDQAPEIIKSEIELEDENDNSDLILTTDSYMEDDEMMMSDYEEEDEIIDDSTNAFNEYNNLDNQETFLDPEDEDFDPEIEEVLSGKYQVPAGRGNTALELNEDDEKRQLDLFLEESENPGSTEEIHLDPRESAVERLKRFRFSLNEFDHEEVDDRTPEEWENILRIRNFRVATNRAFKLFNKKKQISFGDKVKLHLEIPQDQIETAMVRMSKLQNFSTAPFTIFGLLKNEDKESLCNFSIKSWEGYDKPIASKDEIIVQYGSRRQVIKPLYSTNANNADNIHKYLRFSLQDATNIASAIVPINFGRVPVLFFKTSHDQYPKNLELVGSGTFESIDHTRVTVKRALLVGQPFKIHKKVITIRYMFFKPEDINYFKSVPLFTKSGASGYIRESLGTHGYFKASFNRKLSAQDYVYMALYKRVWPKPSTPFIEF